MDFGLGQLIYKVGADIKGFNSGMKEVSRQLNSVDKDGTRAMSGLNKIGTRLTDVGSRLSVGFSLPLIAAGVAATKFSTDMNEGMANVSSLIGGNIVRTQELKAAVQDMAVDVGQRTGTLTSGLYQVVSAFGDSAETAQLLNINARAAAAGLSTVEEAVALTSAVTKGYGDTSATALQKVSDLSFKTVELGQTTFPELAASMGTVVASAAKLGVSQEELFAGFATLTGVTGGTSEVSTQLASILRAMMKPTEDMAKAVAELGFNSAETMVSQLGMKGALDALVGTTDGTTESVAKLFGRAEALNAVFSLTGNQAEMFNTKLAAMENAAGATDIAFKAQTEGINKNGFMLKQVAAQAEVAAQKFGDMLAPMLGRALEAAMPLLDTLGSLVEWFTKLPTPIQNVAFGLGALAIAVGPVMLGLGQLTKTFVSVHEAANLLTRGVPRIATVFNKVAEDAPEAAIGIGKLSSAMKLAGVAVVALGAAWVAWELLKDLYNVIRDLVSPIDDLVDTVKDALQPITTWAENIEVANHALDGLKTGLLNALGPLGYFIDDLESLEQIDWAENIKQGLGPLAGLAAALKGIKALASVYPEMDEAAKKLSDTLRDETVETNRSRLEREAAAKAADIYKRKEEESADATEKAGKAAAKAAEEFRGLKDTLSDIERQDAADRFVDDWIKARIEAGQTLDEIADGIGDVRTEIDGATGEVYDLGEAMREASMADVWEASTSGLQIFREGIDEVPGWITDSVDEANDGILKAGEKYFDQQEKQVKAWKNQVSTILSDLGKNIAGAVWSIFDDGGEGAKLQEQEDALHVSLVEREQSWADYQAEVADKREAALSEYQQTLADGDQALSNSLSERRQKYNEDNFELESSLEDRVRAYADYQDEVAGKLSELRADTAEALAKELEQYQDSLDDKQGRLQEYIEDARTKLDRLRKKNEDDVEDEIQDTERKLADKQLALRREREDTEDKIADLLRAGKSADSTEIRDLQIKLARKEEDYTIFAERQKADLQEYIDEHAAKLLQEENDIRVSLNRRREDYMGDVADAKARHDEVTENLKTKLTEEETKLQESLATRGADLETFKTETIAKQDALAAGWTAYQESAVADFETVKTEAAAKLAEQEADLELSLAKQKGDWEKFVIDTNAELAKIEKDQEGNSIFGRVSSAFGAMIEGMGQSIIRFGAEYLTGKLFKWLVTDLLDDILPRVAGAFSSIFGMGVDVASGAAGAAGSVAGAGGSVAGSVGSVAGAAAGAGVSATIGAVGSIGSMISGIIGNFQSAKQETTLNAIEESTRYAQLFLGGRADQGILGQMFRVGANTEYSYLSLDSIKTSLWNSEMYLKDLAWTWIEKVEANTLGTNSRLDALKPHFEKLDGILDGVKDTATALQKVIEINVSGFGGNRDVGLEIARSLKSQGALA